MNLPQAYLDRMKGQLGDAFDAYLFAMDQPEKRAAHTNGLKMSPAALGALRPDFTPVGGAGFLLPPGFAPGKDVLHCAGAYYVQELSAQVPADLFDLRPTMAVLDLCAAPGGKSAQLAARVPQGVLFANEIVPNRATILLPAPSSTPCWWTPPAPGRACSARTPRRSRPGPRSTWPPAPSGSGPSWPRPRGR